MVCGVTQIETLLYWLAGINYKMKTKNEEIIFVSMILDIICIFWDQYINNLNFS